MTATQWFEVLTSFSLQVLTVILAGKLLERSIVRADDRCAVWNTCFFSILILGCAALLLPRLHLIKPWSLLRPQELLTVSATQAVIGRVLLATWCVGATVAIIRWIVRGHYLRRSLNRCEQLPANQVRLLLSLTANETSDRNLPTLLISDEAEGPFCWQLHQPTIILPRYLLEGSPNDLHHVLIHELEHLKTNHPRQLFLQQLAQVVCWFHPAVWSAAQRASLTREFICDDAATAQGADSAAYLRTLLRIAERCEQNKHSSAIAFGKTPSEIVLRAHRLVDLANNESPKGRSGRLGRKAAICTLLLVTCMMTQVWLPSDPLASSRSFWSPWPTWTAKSLHCFGYCLRDYELFDRRAQVFELQRVSSRDEGSGNKLPAPDSGIQ